MFKTLILSLLTFSVVVSAVEDRENIRKLQEQMKQRVTKIAVLKKAQVVGENSRGFLEIVNPEKTEAIETTLENVKKLLSAENDDRKKVYSLIAAQTGVEPEAVGRTRAKLIYQDAKGFVLVQARDGHWVPKEAMDEKQLP